MYAAKIRLLPPASASADWTPVRGRMLKDFCGLQLQMSKTVLWIGNGVLL